MPLELASSSRFILPRTLLECVADHLDQLDEIQILHNIKIISFHHGFSRHKKLDYRILHEMERCRIISTHPTITWRPFWEYIMNLLGESPPIQINFFWSVIKKIMLFLGMIIVTS